MHKKGSTVIEHSLSWQWSLIQILWQRLPVANPIFIFSLFLSNRTSIYLGAEMCPAKEHFPDSLAGMGSHVKLLWPMEYSQKPQCRASGKALKGDTQFALCPSQIFPPGIWLQCLRDWGHSVTMRRMRHMVKLKTGEVDGSVDS